MTSLAACFAPAEQCRCRHYAKLNPYLLLQERGWLCDLAPDEFAHQNTVAITVADFRVSVENGQLLETGITV